MAFPFLLFSVFTVVCLRAVFKAFDVTYITYSGCVGDVSWLVRDGLVVVVWRLRDFGL